VPRTSADERTRRRHRLIELLSKGLEATQDEIGERLAADGFPATQATISRDLEDVGAVRRHEGKRIVYSLAESNGPPVGFGRRVFGELVRRVATSGNLVVVRTYPGMAPTVAAVLDQGEVDGILGTVAGDDTVLVVADEGTGSKKVAKRITEIGRRV
jgi:transcriptional regulator of arginine metabolism